MSTHKKNERVTTPAGKALYPRLTKPDTKFNADGEFKVDLLLPQDDAAPLIEKIDAMIAEAHKKAIEEAKTPAAKKKIKAYNVQTPYEEHVDEDGNETGEIKFKFKQKAKITGKDGDPIKMRVAIFDAKLKPIKGDLMAGSGSVMKVSFEMVPYCIAGQKAVGVTLRLKAVQILELVEYGGGDDASAFGFGEEDGFEDSGDGSEDFEDDTSDDDDSESEEDAEDADF